MRFEELPLDATTQLALEAMGFEEATPIQAQTIPSLLEGRDLVAQAQTGTGKTAAFGIPLIEACRMGRRGLVLTPTRELAKQVQRELQAIAKNSPVDVVCLIGGASFQDQVRALQRHPNAILVATPGRVVDHLTRGTLRLDGMALLVLDEADEMLSMGFQDEVDAIVGALPRERQTMMFSATMPPSIERLAKKTLRDPVTVRAGGAGRPGGAAATVFQGYAIVRADGRADAARRLIAVEDPKATLLFCKTRNRVEDLARELQDIGAEPLHGGMQQGARDAAMSRIRDGRSKLLVATDVAARGLDVEDIELVLHDEPATDAETYVHRVGRTGRAGRTGRSILLLAPGAMRRLKELQRVAGHLERVEIPDDDALAAIKLGRLISDLQAVEPGAHAHRALKQALDSGLTERDIALRALDMLDAAAPEPEVIAPTANQTAGIGLKVGTFDGVSPGDIVGALTRAGGLRGEDVGRIDILPRMSVAEVPAAEMERLMEVLQRVQVRGQWLKPRLAEGWRFKAGRR